MSLLTRKPLMGLAYPDFGQGPKEDIFSPTLADILVVQPAVPGQNAIAEAVGMESLGSAIPNKDYRAVVAPNGEVINIVTKGYVLIDDNYIQEQIDAICGFKDETGKSLVLHSRKHGSRWSTSWTIAEPEPLGELEYNNEKYAAHYIMRIDNSYDSSKALSVRGGIQIMKCRNQLVGSGPIRTGDFYSRHSSKVTVNFDTILRAAAAERNRYAQNIGKINNAATRVQFELALQDILEAFPETKMGPSAHAITLDNIFTRDRAMYGDGHFGLFMAATELATYPEHYKLPMSYVTPLNNAINNAFRLN
jgi:hypothetical protein